MSDLFGNLIVGFPTRRLNCNITDSLAELTRIMSDSGVLFYTFNSFKVTGGYFAVCLIATLIAVLAIVQNVL